MRCDCVSEWFSSHIVCPQMEARQRKRQRRMQQECQPEKLGRFSHPQESQKVVFSCNCNTHTGGFRVWALTTRTHLKFNLGHTFACNWLDFDAAHTTHGKLAQKHAGQCEMKLVSLLGEIENRLPICNMSLDNKQRFNHTFGHNLWILIIFAPLFCLCEM